MFPYAPKSQPYLMCPQSQNSIFASLSKMNASNCLETNVITGSYHSCFLFQSFISYLHSHPFVFSRVTVETSFCISDRTEPSHFIWVIKSENISFAEPPHIYCCACSTSEVGIQNLMLHHLWTKWANNAPLLFRSFINWNSNFVSQFSLALYQSLPRQKQVCKQER